MPMRRTDKANAVLELGEHVLGDHPYLTGNFAPISRELPLTPCSFTGIIPVDLGGGQYVRNGGNPITNSDIGRDAHWFDGDGMLSGVLFRRVGDKHTEMQPEFVNQYVLTDMYTYASNKRSLRRPILPSVATLVNPLTSAMTLVLAVLRSIMIVLLSWIPGSPRRIKKISVANTNILYHDGRALATCESGPPMRISLPSLRTVGWFNGRTAENEVRKSKRKGFGGNGVLSFMKEWTTAHPRVDPVTGDLIAFHAVFIKPFVYYSIVPPAKSRTRARFDMPIPGLSSPKMMHDFGVSALHTVVMDLPLLLDPGNIIKGIPALSYDTAGKSRFGVFPRYQPDAIQWFETNPCCIFHTANCWDKRWDRLSVDAAEAVEYSVHLLACRLTSASLIFSAGNLPTPEVKPVPPEYAEEEQCRLYYYSFPLSPSSSVKFNIRHQWALSAISFEFPTMNPKFAMRESRFIYGCSTSSSTHTVALGKAAKIDFLAKVDVETLVAKGVANPPQPIKGCVDTRSVHEIVASNDPRDPIKLFAMPAGCFAQEPRFVPRVNARSEDDGWLLTYVFDEAQLDELGRCSDDSVSELWIIDATTMRDVVARVRLPQRVPYGLHGAWFPEHEIASQRPYARLRENR